MKKKTKTEKKVIGQLGVDSGTLMIGDPCYAIHRETPYKEFGKNWLDFCDTVLGDHADSVYPVGDGLAVAVSTVYGDGVYNLVGTYTSGVLTKIEVDLRG